MKIHRPALVFPAIILSVLVLVLIWSSGQLPGTATDRHPYGERQLPSQTDNPNYPARNPFYFEGKIDYELLGVDEPSNAWEFLQRGIWYQDDQDDPVAAKSDYRRSIELSNVRNGTCRIIRSEADLAIRDPAPCMFTPRLRLAYLLLHDDPEESIRLFNEVLEIDPLFLEVNQLIGEAYQEIADRTEDPAEKLEAYEAAVNAFRAELALAPVGNPEITPDRANYSIVHWLLVEVYEDMGDQENAISELESYLEATRWHSDVLPWRIPLARKRVAELRGELSPSDPGPNPNF